MNGPGGLTVPPPDDGHTDDDGYIDDDAASMQCDEPCVIDAAGTYLGEAP